MIKLVYRLNPSLANDELNALFDVAWQEHTWRNFESVLNRSLVFVCAYHGEQLIGFVNLAWDGGFHAFILDTTVHLEFRRRGIGQELVRRAAAEAKNHEVEWLHVDFEPHLQDFYESCGFTNTAAGLLRLESRS
jgi:ribosomal protein S18 acetylase RimI-like enzyme